MAQIISFVSGKGGVGKSSVSSGVACALAKLGKRVLLIDMDIGLRSLDLIFDIGDTIVYNWGDVLLDTCAPGQAVKKARGVHLLSAPLKDDAAFTRARMAEMLDIFADAFDFILLDAPAGFTRGFSLACAGGGLALILATPDEISARAANTCVDALLEEEIRDTRLIVNRFSAKLVQKGLSLNIDDMIDKCAVRLIGVVPEDRSFALLACAGRSFFDNPAYFAIENIAKRLCGEEIPLKRLEKFGNV